MHDRWWRELRAMASLPIRFIAFDANAFDPLDFVRHGIEQPVSIVKAVPKRQAEFLAGRIAARDALLRLGSMPEPVGIGSGRQPLWPTGVTGSISHSDGVAAAVAVSVRRCLGIGIDIERVVGTEAFAALRTTVIGAAEGILLEEDCASLSLSARLTIFFSAKESFFKGVYAQVGRYFDFTDVTISVLNTDECWVELTVNATLSTELWPGRSFYLPFALVEGDMILTAFAW